MERERRGRERNKNTKKVGELFLNSFRGVIMIELIFLCFL